jgi:hypothetical protein
LLVPPGGGIQVHGRLPQTSKWAPTVAVIVPLLETTQLILQVSGSTSLTTVLATAVKPG